MFYFTSKLNALIVEGPIIFVWISDGDFCMLLASLYGEKDGEYYINVFLDTVDWCNNDPTYETNFD